MAKKATQAAASSGYWENLRRKRRREQEQRGQITQEGYKNLLLGRIAGALGLGPDIAEFLTPPLVTPSASLKAKGQKPFPAGMTRGEMPPKDGKGLEYKYTSADFAKKFGISPAELITGDVVGPGAPVSAVTGLGKGAAAAIKGLNLADLGAAASAVATGIFAGKRARNLPKLSYDRALEGEKAGLSKYQIYEETGFWQGPEGQWRFEIDDKDIKFKPDALKSFEEILGQELLIGAPGEVERLQRVRYAPITEVVDHPELFEAYPELKEYYIKIDPEGEYSGGFGGKAAGYQQGQGEIVPLPDGTQENKPVIMLRAPTRDSEITRLKKLLETEKEQLIDFNENLNFMPPGSDEFKELQKLVINQEKAIAGIETQLQSLRDGAQPDITFSVKSTLTHELQHAVQDIENFPRGGGPSTAERQTEAAIHQLAEQTGKSLTEIRQAVSVRNYKIAQIAALDQLLRLQFLQRYKFSDNPTGSARLIENSSMNYGLTQAEESWLGPKPKRHKRKEYGDYLRRKAELFQAKIIDDILKRENEPDGFYNVFVDAISEVKRYEATRGKVDLSHVKRENFHPRNLGNVKFYEGRQLANPDDIRHPNYLAIPENVIKNAIMRKSRQADKSVGDQNVLSSIEKATRELEKVRQDNPFDYQTELYYRLAGESEARAVQERFQQATKRAELSGDFEIYQKFYGDDDDTGMFKIRGGPSYVTDRVFRTREEAQKFLDDELGFEDRIPTAMKEYGGAYDRDPEKLAFYYPRDQVPSVPAAAAINVPKSDVGFTSPALRVIMESPKEQMPKEQWRNYLKGNGVKDDELEFSGLGEWLNQQKGQVRRADLENYMTTQNQLKIEEVNYGGVDSDVLVQRYIREMGDRYETHPIGELPEFEDEITEEVNQLVQDWRDGYTVTSALTMSPLDIERQLPLNITQEQKAREAIENRVRGFHVVIDENGEYMRDSGGDLLFFNSSKHADQEIEHLVESQARTMPLDELEDILNLPEPERSKNYFGPVKYPGLDLNLPGLRDNYRELVLYWDKPVEGGPGTETLWHGSHQFTDKPNPILHIRFTERIDSEGKRILVIEEIQSDIATSGRKEGFQPKGYQKSTPKIDELKKQWEDSEKEYMDEFAVANANAEGGLNKLNALDKKRKKLEKELEAEKIRSIELPPKTKITMIDQNTGLPVKEKAPHTSVMYKVETPEKYHDRLRNQGIDTFFGMTEEEAVGNAKHFIRNVQERALNRGPFIMDTKDYMELGLKRMILWASENGFDKLAWTTGKQQMERYRLSKHVNKITYMPPEPGSDMYFTGAEDKQGNMIRGYKADGTLDELAEIYGTDITEKMRKGEGTINQEDPKQIDLTGIDLDITNPKHFLMIAYDRVLKNVAQKLGKKYDAKVGMGDLVVNDAPWVRLPGQENVPEAKVKYGMGDPIKEKVWTLNLSEKLKSAAEKGLPYMVVVPPAAMMMDQEQDRTPINRAAARPIMENYAN